MRNPFKKQNPNSVDSVEPIEPTSADEQKEVKKSRFFERRKNQPDVIESPEQAESLPITEKTEPDKVEKTGLFKRNKSRPDDVEAEEPIDSNEKKGFFNRLKNRLSKTRKAFSGGIDRIFQGKHAIDEDLLEALEELLITSDIGVQTSMDLIEKISKESGEISNAGQLKAVLKNEIISLLSVETSAFDSTIAKKPHVIMVVGVNGTGKTTTIGKIADKAVAEGKKVLIAAADTFRAAAVDQIAIWAERAGADIVKHKENADPAAVVYDSIQAALSRDTDLVLIDTAGRLHTKVNLMEELKKIKRTISKIIPEAPHEILLVLDATTGQNAVSQATLFNEAISISGIVLTKLDGTAKGGIVVSISQTLHIPLRYIGIGEKIEDLQPFEPFEFAEALFGDTTL